MSYLTKSNIVITGDALEDILANAGLIIPNDPDNFEASFGVNKNGNTVIRFLGATTYIAPNTDINIVSADASTVVFSVVKNTPNSSNTFVKGNFNVADGVLSVKASDTSLPSIRIPHGTAPSAPVNGDVWTTIAGLFVRVNGVTVGPLT